MIKNRPLCSVCLVVFTVTLAIVFLGKDRYIKELRPSPLEQTAKPGDNVTVTGRVYKLETRQNRQILYLKDNSIIHKQQSLKESRILIYDNSKEPVQIGNALRVKGEVSFFDTARNPGNFDQKLYYQKQDIHARIWAETCEVSDGHIQEIKNALHHFRNSWKAALTEVMGQKQGNALSAIMLGDKAGMDQELKELYQANGIGHIFAISGLHLSFIGIGIYQLLRRISGSYLAGGVFGIFFLTVYILMVGFSVSAVRALVMFLFRVGADMTGRCYDAPTALSAAAVAVILWRPLSVYDGGFWLSFGAVLGIITVLPVFEGLPAGGFWASAGINLMIFPIVLYYFYEFPTYSLVLNLVVIPLMSVLLTLGFAGSALSCVLYAVGRPVLKGCSVILSLYEGLCKVTSRLPGALTVTGKPAPIRIIIYYGCLFFALILWRRNGRSRGPHRKGELQHKSVERRILAGAVCLFLGGIALLVPRRLDDGLQVAVLDVGQGDGIFMRDASGTTYFIDGGSSDVKQVGKYRIEPYLKSQGVKTLDYVFISHGDSDHMNGIEEMIERQLLGVRIKNLVLPVQEVWDEALRKLAAKAQGKGIRVAAARPGVILRRGTCTVTCVQPGEDYGGEPGNSASMVLAVNAGWFDMLLTGDMEGDGEQQFLEEFVKNDSGRTWEVLKVAHHGSRNSSGEAFLEAVRPVYAVISAGRDNRYGHPHEETLKRLESSGCRIVSTQDSGAILLKVGKEQSVITKYLQK